MLDARISSCPLSNVSPVCIETKLSYSTRISRKLDDPNTWLALPERAKTQKSPAATGLQRIELHRTGKHLLPVECRNYS